MGLLLQLKSSTPAFIRARPLVVVAVCTGIFCPPISLKCSTVPPPSWLTWINEPCYLRGDHVAVWVIQKNENGLMNMPVRGLLRFLLTARRALSHPQDTLNRHPTVFTMKPSTSLYSLFPLCVWIFRRSFLRCAEKCGEEAEMGRNGDGVDLWAWTGECGSSLACCYDVFVVLGLL